MNPHKFLVENGFRRRSEYSKFYEIELNGFNYTIKFKASISFEIKKQNTEYYSRNHWLSRHRIDSEDILCSLRRHPEFSDLYAYIQNKKRRDTIDDILKDL